MVDAWLQSRLGTRALQPVIHNTIRPGDVRKLAVSEGARKYYPDLEPGDMLNLRIDGKDESWEVVGIFKFVDREGVLAYA